MRTIVSSEEMRRCDDAAIRRFGIPGLLLMDRAGSAAARTILESFTPRPDDVIAVVCGKGNNGGDGCVVARDLVQSGMKVHLLLVAPPNAFHGDAAAHFDILRRLARSESGRCSISRLSSVLRDRSFRPSIVVDALLGTGSSGKLRGSVLKAVEWINRSGARVVALDVPTGIDGTTGAGDGPYVKAVLTVTFGFVKRGLLLNEGREAAGRVDCVDIGLPASVLTGVRRRTNVVERKDVEKLLPQRPHTLHKYTAGKVLILAGSKGFTGAAALCASGALRSGAGAVVLAVPDNIHGILARKLTEQILMSVPSSPDGTFGLASMPALSERLSWADAVVIGPGIGRSKNTLSFLQDVLWKVKVPTVIDADALTLLADSHIIARRHAAPWILTPHTGELSRLTHATSAELERERIDAARSFSRKYGLTLVFKGSPTISASADGSVVINSTGNPGMATVGSGDVLAGIVGGLCAQGIAPGASSWLGVFIHGMAGDLAREKYGERAMVAGDIVDMLPEAIRSLETNKVS